MTKCVSSDRAIVQAVSRLVPTAAARVRAEVRSCGICVTLLTRVQVMLVCNLDRDTNSSDVFVGLSSVLAGENWDAT
jgi:hypothetical protein